MKKWTSSAIIIVLLIIISTSLSCSRRGLEERVVEFTLPNGMKWLLVKRGYAPVFAGIVQVKVGGVDEAEGKTGLAHMLEHMAFKGTSQIGTTDFEEEKKIMEKIDAAAAEGRMEALDPLAEEQKKYIVPNELWDIFTRNGATNMNAYTSKDVTAYYSEMPNSKLELWLYTTSEMIKDPAFRQFYKERDVVMEEYRSSMDDDPTGQLFRGLLLQAYQKSPYRWPTLGFKGDIQGFTRPDLIEFYKKNYLPECMVGSIVGDINIDETKRLIERYFGPMKGRGGECEREIPEEPAQEELRELNVTYDAEPLVAIAFHKPTAPAFDDYIFDVFQTVLCEGESSRMQRHLVNEKKVAKSVTCFNSYPGTRLDNMFVVYAEPFSGVTLDELKSEIIGELKGMIDEPVETDEFQKAKNQMKTSFLTGLDSNFELAHMLVYYENLTGGWRYMLRHSENIDKIKIKDLIEAAGRYFVPENMTVVTLKKGEK